MTPEELAKALDKERKIIIRYSEDGSPYVSMPVGNIPMKQFEEWEQVCKAEYNGNRWLMIWTQFMRMRQFDLQVETEARIAMLLHEEQQVVEPQNPLGLLK